VKAVLKPCPSQRCLASSGRLLLTYSTRNRLCKSCEPWQKINNRFWIGDAGPERLSWRIHFAYQRRCFYWFLWLMVLSKVSSDPLHIDYANLYHACWNLKKSSLLTLYSPFLLLTWNNLCISFDDVSDFPRSTLQHQLLMLDSHTAASFQYGRGKREGGIHWHWRNIVSLPMINFLTREYSSSCTTNSLWLSWCHLTLHYNVTNTILSLSRRLNCRKVEIIVRSKVTLTHSKCTSYIFFRLLNGDNSAHRVASTCNLLSLYYAAASIKLSIACRLTMVGF
jgi:hypothetical protein